MIIVIMYPISTDFTNDNFEFNSYPISNDLTNANFELKAYPLVFYHNYNEKNYLENTNKVLLPLTILNKINRYSDNITGNIIFELKGNSDITFNVSVDDFIDDIDDMYMSLHIMDILLLNDGDSIQLNLKNISIGNKITLQPHTSDLLEMEDYKTFLEQQLNTNYDILTIGDTISLPFSNKQIYFNIIECLPDDTICIKNTDLQVEFTEPLDYPEYLEKKKQMEIEKQNKIIEQQKLKQQQKMKQMEDDKIKKEKGYVPFGGIGRKLNE